MRFFRAPISAGRPRRTPLKALAAAVLVSASLAAPAASAATVSAAPAPPAGLVFAPHVGAAHPGGPALIQHAAVTSSAVKYNAQSGNWSGYAATAAPGYTQVSSTWVEPSANCSATPNSYASFWTGFDGYNSASVEQTGTLVYCYGTTAYQYVWYEFYPAAPVYYNAAIYAGDTVRATVTSTAAGAYSLVLSNLTRGWTATTTATNASLPRSSAEIIAEAPASSSGVLPLADFGSVTFTSSTVNNVALSSSGPTGIDMVGPSYYKAITGGISGGTSFPVTWEHS